MRSEPLELLGDVIVLKLYGHDKSPTTGDNWMLSADDL